jgi:hypothetical protein
MKLILMLPLFFVVENALCRKIVIGMRCRSCIPMFDKIVYLRLGIYYNSVYPGVHSTSLPYCTGELVVKECFMPSKQQVRRRKGLVS